jgi:hypothetical protein
MNLIDVGKIANDGTGDDLREAFIKVNQNFEELDLREPESTEVTNLGGGAEIFKSKNGSTLGLRTLDAGTNITLTTVGDTIQVSAVGGLQSLTVASDSGNLQLQDGDTFNVKGTSGASTSVINNELVIDAITLAQDPNPSLLVNLDANGQNINNANIINATTFIGGLNGNVWGVDVRNFAKYTENLDLGSTVTNVTNFMEYLVATIDVEMGTFTSPTTVNIDLGSF